MPYEIIEKLKKAIEGYQDEAQWEEIGHVIEAGDGILKITGLTKAMSQEILIVDSQAGEIKALTLNLEEDVIGALVLGEAGEIKSGDTVRRTGQVLSIPVTEKILSRVIDPLGNPLDGEGSFWSKKIKPTHQLLENKAPSVLERQPVNAPLHTGIKSIDAMFPIGRGQRELIIGDRQIGKTALALDTIINQLYEEEKNRPVCIYVSIGQKESKIAKIMGTLKKFDALKYTVIVAASASSPASWWYLAPFAGCAIGEYFRDLGRDALIIYDDLTKHAWAYRQISLLLRRPPGREAYPGDIFYLHSRLLERAAKLSQNKGGGSLTALPIVETQLGDVTGYIPTNVISITDGQIYLESDLFYQGIRPAINIGLSVSRVGSAAQTKAMKKVAGRLKLALAQFRELQAFVQFAAEVDETTRKKIHSGQIITEILKQPDLAPIPFEKQVVLLYASLNNYFDDYQVEEIKKLKENFFKYMDTFHQDDLLSLIKEKKELTEKIEEKIKKVIEKFIKTQIKKKK